MKTLFFYFFLFYYSLCANAQDNHSFFEANEAYGNQNYPKAIELLESMTTHSFARYFNLGCAYQKNNEISKAWVAFEKAKQIKPYDKNLKYALHGLLLTQDQKKFIPLYQTSFFINIFTVLTCIFFWLTMIFWIRRKGKQLIHKNALFFSLLCFLLSGGFLCASSRIFKKCIVVNENATVHISPTSQAEIIKTLPAGTPINISTKYGNFLHFSLQNGQNGWIDCKNVKTILD